MMSEQTGRELDWDDEIQRDNDFVLLPEGEYEFVVESFERARHTPKEGGKLPACKMAIVKIRIESKEGTTFINHNLYLHTSTEGMLSAFFRAIGQKKKDEPLKMNWPVVPGSTGRAKIGIHKYNGNEYNEIKRFLPKEEKKFEAGKF